jgi:predicted DNA-binding transcriptional regulator YafY
LSSKVIYERFLWFHSKVKEKKYPNSKSLAEQFEISSKTAQRDIEFMQDRLYSMQDNFSSELREIRLSLLQKGLKCFFGLW